MNFWGVEVKAGQILKVKPEDYNVIHVSQASLGEVKDAMEGPKYVPLRLKFGDKDFVLGSLSAEHKPQLQFDLVIEKEFELSHGWKDGSVYFLGFSAYNTVISSDSEYSSDTSSDEDVAMAAPENGHAEPNSLTADAAKTDAENGDIDSISDDVNDSKDVDDSSEEEQELPKVLLAAPKSP